MYSAWNIRCKIIGYTLCNRDWQEILQHTGIAVLTAIGQLIRLRKLTNQNTGIYKINYIIDFIIPVLVCSFWSTLRTMIPWEAARSARPSSAGGCPALAWASLGNTISLMVSSSCSATSTRTPNRMTRWCGSTSWWTLRVVSVHIDA